MDKEQVVELLDILERIACSLEELAITRAEARGRYTTGDDGSVPALVDGLWTLTDVVGNR